MQSRGEAAGPTPRRRAGPLTKTLIAVWVAFLLAGALAQLTELGGSLAATLIWCVLGLLGAVLFIAYGGPRVIDWLEARDELS